MKEGGLFMLDYRIKTFLTLCETMNYRQTAELLQDSRHVLVLFRLVNIAEQGKPKMRIVHACRG